jgi:NAD-dependent dihydropyrimidine dehydrogenase PreA subunit
MLYVDENRCSGCGVCVGVCPAGAISLQDGRATIDQTVCTECGACEAACPETAILTVSEPALVPERTPDVARLEPKPAPLPVGARLAPVIGAALVFFGREIVPRLSGYVMDALDRRMRAPSTDGDTTDAASRTRVGGAGAGRRSRRRRRGGR